MIIASGFTKELVSISAEYTGDRGAGTEITGQCEDISVTAEYSDGSTEYVDGWKLEKPGTLEKDKTSTFTITYEGMTCELEVVCEDMSEEVFKANCKEVDYESYSTQQYNYLGQNIKVTGFVQHVHNGTGSIYTLSVDENYSQLVCIKVRPNKYGHLPINQKDTITVYGTYCGIEDMETFEGVVEKVPVFQLKYYEK